MPRRRSRSKDKYLPYMESGKAQPGLAQSLAEFVVIRPARILHTQGGMELIGGLPLAYRCHVHCDQLTHFWWDACRCAVPDFFIIADVEIGGLGWLSIRLAQRLDGSNQAGQRRLCHPGGENGRNRW